MSKTKSAFFCQSCGYESVQWLGKCPGCNNWNTFVEEVIVKGTDKKEKDDWKEYAGLGKLKTISINPICLTQQPAKAPWPEPGNRTYLPTEQSQQQWPF